MSYMESRKRLHTEQANAPLNLTRTFAVSRKWNVESFPFGSGNAKECLLTLEMHFYLF